MPAAVAYGIWSLIREVVALGGSTMSSVDYFTTVLSKLAYAKDKLSSCVAHSVHLLGSRGPFSEKKPSGTQGTAVYRTLFD